MTTAMTQATTFAATSTAPAGGFGGVSGVSATLSPLHALAHMLNEESQPDVPATDETPIASGPDAPENPPVPGAEDTPGELTSTPEETPPAETEPGDGEPPNPVSDTAPAKPQITKATQERIDKLTAEKYRLREENEALQAKLAEASEPRPTSPEARALPESVTKLKTLQQVQARHETLESAVDQLNDFLDANPGDPRTVYDLDTAEPVNVESDGKRYLSRQQLIARRAEARAELKALPKHAQHIVRTAELKTTHAQHQARLQEKFPQLKDDSHAETQMYRAALALPELAQHPDAPLIAYKLARGHLLVEAEMAKANGNGKPLFGKPVSKVPVRQSGPSGNGALSPSRPGATDAQISQAMDGLGRQGSKSSLAAVLSATGR